jgi:FAD/FMN-containing dehydrogenase
MAPRITHAGDPAWEAERATFNLLDDQHPAAIAVAEDAADVSAAVRHAAEHGLAVARSARVTARRPWAPSTMRCS